MEVIAEQAEEVGIAPRGAYLSSQKGETKRADSNRLAPEPSAGTARDAVRPRRRVDGKMPDLATRRLNDARPPHPDAPPTLGPRYGSEPQKKSSAENSSSRKSSSRGAEFPAPLSTAPRLNADRR